MATYIYQASDGEQIEREFEMLATRPQSITVNGKTYERLLVVPQTLIKEYTHKSYSQHRKKDAIRLGLPLAPNYDEKGVACYRTANEIDKHEADYSRAGKNMKYDREKLKGKKVT